MSEHVMATIAEIEGRIGKLMGLRDGLQAFLEGGGGVEAIRVSAAAESAVPVRGMPKVKVKQKETKGALKVVDMLRGVFGKLKGECKSDVIKGAVLAKYPGYEKKIKVGIYYALQALVEKGELASRREAGAKDWLYGVNDTKPVSVTDRPPQPQEREPAKRPSNGKEREKLEAALENARKQVAHAKEQGRSTMVEIFERDVERLEKELGI